MSRARSILRVRNLLLVLVAGRPYLLAARDPDRESGVVPPNDPDRVGLPGKPGVYRVMNPPRTEPYDE